MPMNTSCHFDLVHFPSRFSGGMYQLMLAVNVPVSGHLRQRGVHSLIPMQV